MSFAAAVLFASVTVFAPLNPASAIDLSTHGSAASDVAWLNDNELLVALIEGGVVRVSAKTHKSSLWLKKGPLPDGSPYPEMIATDGNLVVVLVSAAVPLRPREMNVH